jgi:ATP-dependent DNA ligase
MQKEIRARLDSLPKTEASFVEPMECQSVSKLPEGSEWIWEIKLDGYRALSVNSGSGVTLFSRRRKSLNRQFPYIVDALANLPEGTVIDGEVVAIDDRGCPDFNLLQNFRAEASRVHYHVFDLLCWRGRDLTRLALIERRALLKGFLALQDKRISLWITSRRRQTICLPQSESKGLKESSANERTACTNPENAAAPGSSIA